MKRILKKFNSADALFLAIVSIIYYVLLRQHFIASDDSFYTFIHPSTTEKVQSLWDAIRSQYWDYFNFNARPFVHTLTQWMCSVSYGRELYFIVGTFVHSWLILGLLYIIRINDIHSGVDKYVVLSSLFFLIPYYGMVVIGQISFVTNYTWSACLFVWFYITIQEIQKSTTFSLHKIILLAVFGFVFGAWQESFTVPTAGALFCYYVVHPRELFTQNPYKYALYGGFILGVFFQVFAPANILRLQKEQSGGCLSLGRFINVVKACLDSIRILVLFLILIFGVILCGWKKSWRLIKRNIFFVIVAIINILFTAVVAYHDNRQLYIGVLSLILINTIVWLSAYKVNQVANRLISGICAISLIIAFIPVYSARKSQKEAWTSAQREYKNSAVNARVLHNLLYKDNAHRFVFYYTEIGFLAPNMKVFLPDTKENIARLFPLSKPIDLKKVPDTECYAIDMPLNMPNSEVRLSVQSRTSYIGQILHRFNQTEVTDNTICIPENYNEFAINGRKYVVFYMPSYEYPRVNLAKLTKK